MLQATVYPAEISLRASSPIRSSHLWLCARLTLFTGKNSFEIQIRKRRLISISKDVLLKNEVRRAYYHTWEERIWASEASRPRTRERAVKPRGPGPSLARSREARFACPNRRACSQASWDSWLLLSYLSWILRIFLVAKIIRLVMERRKTTSYFKDLWVRSLSSK